VAIPDLVAQAQGTGAEAAHAAEQLVEIGEPAIPAIVEAISSPFLVRPHLPAALTAIYVNAPVEIPVEALGTDKYNVFAAAVRALTERADPAGAAAIAEHLRDPDQNPVRRAILATAAGDLGDPAAVPALHSALADSLAESRDPEDDPGLTLEAIAALAKLGDFEPGGSAVDLLSDPYPPAAAHAARVLSIAVGPGMVAGLARLVREGDPEAARAAIEPLFLVGTAEAADALIDAASESGDSIVRNDAVIRASEIVGGLTDDLDLVRRRRSEAQSSMRAGVRYRGGEPFTVAALLDLIAAADERSTPPLLAELTFAVGRRFTAAPDAATRASLAQEFPTSGAYYRWGHRVPGDLITG
jgi:HEAT repeat protein